MPRHDKIKDKSPGEILAERVQIATTKTFIRRYDFQMLLNRCREYSNKAYNLIKGAIEQELKEDNKILPSDDLLPLSMVWKYLKPYGITKSSIISDYETFKRLFPNSVPTETQSKSTTIS